MIWKRAALKFTDKRGQIYDIITGEDTFDSVSMIRSNAGAIRGNHYHKDTHQYLHMIKGRLKYYYIPTSSEIPDKFKTTKTITLTEDDIVYTEPNEIHAMEILEDDTVFMVYTKGPRSGANYESDTFRVENIVVSETE